MHDFAAWLKQTPLSGFVTGYPWVWPTCETLHFIGLSLLIGVTSVLDLRLLGWMRPIPVWALKRLLPWAWLGFGLNLCTGILFIAGDPFQYVDNVAFRFKLLFIGVAGLNAAAFELTGARRARLAGAGADTPRSAKVIAAIGLLSWAAVLYFGRMLVFVGNAF